MRALAIDFETANERRDSACAIGLAFIDDGVVTRREYRLIRPPELRFHPGNVRVHGILPAHVTHEPEFPEVWREFAGAAAGRVFVAHNAAFDSAVLAAMLAFYRMEAPPVTFACSLQLARRAWPDLPGHRLNQLGAFLGVPFRHHHAGEDAYACARIALAALEALGETSFAAARMRAPRRGGGRAVTPGRRAASRSGPVIMVRGSRGDVWRVRVSMDAGGRTACDCPAGRFGRVCRHVKALADGVVDDVISCEEVELSAALARIRRQLA